MKKFTAIPKLAGRIAYMNLMAIPILFMGTVTAAVLFFLFLGAPPLREEMLGDFLTGFETFLFIGPGILVALLITGNRLAEENKINLRTALRAGTWGAFLSIAAYLLTIAGIASTKFDSQIFWFLPTSPIAVIAEILEWP